MLFSVFLGLGLLALFFIVLGYSVRESSYNVIGFVFLFVLATTVGGALGSGNLLLQTHSNKFTEYNYNIDGVLSNQTETLTPVYHSIGEDSDWSWFMRWLAIISAVGMLVSIIEIKRDRRPLD